MIKETLKKRLPAHHEIDEIPTFGGIQEYALKVHFLFHLANFPCVIVSSRALEMTSLFSRLPLSCERSLPMQHLALSTTSRLEPLLLSLHEQLEFRDAGRWGS